MADHPRWLGILARPSLAHRPGAAADLCVGEERGGETLVHPRGELMEGQIRELTGEQTRE